MRKLLFLLFLTACKRPYVEPHEICVMSTKVNLRSPEEISSLLQAHYGKFKRTGNLRTYQADIFDTVGICTCKNFDFMTGESTGELVDYPISKCNTLTGTDYAFFVKNLKPYYEEIDRYFRKEAK